MISRDQVREEIKKGILKEYEVLEKRTGGGIFALRIIIDDYGISSYMMGETMEVLKEENEKYRWDTWSWSKNVELDEACDFENSLYHGTKLFFEFYEQEKDNIDDLDEFRLSNIVTYMEAILLFKESINKDIFFILASEDDKKFEYETGKILNGDSKYLKDFLDSFNYE